jgi:hypothetical protein
MTSTNTSYVTALNQSFKMSFGGIGLITIERGNWFDGFRMAEAPRQHHSARKSNI